MTTVPMAAKVEPPSSPSLTSLPDEIIVNCLARISKSQYRSLSLVSKTFHSLLSSRYLYVLRSQIGNTEPCLYVCLQSPTHCGWFTLDQTLIIKDGKIKDELSLAPIIMPSSSSNPPTPSNSTTVAVGSEIYQISECSSSVHVLDCLSHTWRRAPNMLVPRKSVKCVCLEENIFVIGGRGDEDWGEVFDVKNQTWKLLPCPSEKLHSEHQVVVFGGRLYIITKDHCYSYDPKEGQWTKGGKWLGLGSAYRQEMLTKPCCVIENLLCYEYWHCRGYYCCYDSSSKEWFFVEGLENLRMKSANDYSTIQLVNFAGKLVIIWNECVENTNHEQSERICCAVIKLKKQKSEIGGENVLKWREHDLEIWGEIVMRGAFPNSYKQLLSCQSVSL